MGLLLVISCVVAVMLSQCPFARAADITHGVANSVGELESAKRTALQSGGFFASCVCRNDRGKILYAYSSSGRADDLRAELEVRAGSRCGGCFKAPAVYVVDPKEIRRAQFHRRLREGADRAWCLYYCRSALERVDPNMGATAVDLANAKADYALCVQR